MQRWGTLQNFDSGFTLIELLVTIVVVGVLTAVAIVGMNGLQDKGANAACISTQDAARAATLAYYANSSGTYPQTFGALTNPPTGEPMLTVAAGIQQSPTQLTGQKGQWTLTLTPGATPTEKTTFGGC